MRIIKIGDIVHYKPWGTGASQTAQVQSIEICRHGAKYGREVTTCDLDKHSEVVLDLDDNHWCYKNQIVKIESN